MSLGLNIDKKKWDNFWYYYKIHVIVGVFVAILLAITLKDCAANISPDVTISYIGGSYVPEDVSLALKEKLMEAGIVQDANRDGKNELVFQAMTLSDEIKSEQDIAMQQKVMVVLATGDSQVFLLDKTYFTRYGEQGAFEPLDNLVDRYGIDFEKHPEIKLTVSEMNETHVYALPVKGNKLLEDLGFKTEDTYIAIRAQGVQEKQKEKQRIINENAYAVLNEIMKYSQ